MNIASLLSFSVFYKLFYKQKAFDSVSDYNAFYTFKKNGICSKALYDIKKSFLFCLRLALKLYQPIIKKLQLLFLSYCLLFSSLAQAVKISFPDEELATESVLPQVDIPAMVLNRNINLKNRVELNVSLGAGLDEPFFFSLYPMGQLTFHVTEVHSVSLLGIYYPPLLSSTGNNLKEGKGLSEGRSFDATKAPYPQMSAFLNYQYSPFYGKISLSKILNLNLSIYGFTGLGLVVSSQADRFPAANIGIGQKLYITKWLGLRGDLAFYGYYGPSIAKIDLNLGPNDNEIKYSQLTADQKTVNLNILASLGVIFLL